MISLASMFGVPGPKVFYYSLNGLRTVGDEENADPIVVANPLDAATTHGPKLVLEDSGIAGLPVIRFDHSEQTGDTELLTFSIPAALYDTRVVMGMLLDLLAE